jgi:hypothetical protein
VLGLLLHTTYLPMVWSMATQHDYMAMPVAVAHCSPKTVIPFGLAQAVTSNINFVQLALA